jgi:hypothetical protein
MINPVTYIKYCNFYFYLNLKKLTYSYGIFILQHPILYLVHLFQYFIPIICRSMNNSNNPNAYCSGGMPPFMPPMHHNMYPGSHMGMMPSMLGQLPMNGMARHPLSGLVPPPLAHPPRSTPMPNHCTAPATCTQSSDMPVIKQEPHDTGFVISSHACFKYKCAMYICEKLLFPMIYLIIFLYNLYTYIIG